MKEFIIDKLTELLINQDIKDKKNGSKEYVSKVTAYRGLIKLFKNWMEEYYDELQWI